MTVSELIAELSKHPPGKEVRVCVRRFDMDDEAGHWTTSLTEQDALEADDVRNEGGFVLIWGGRA